ncbi:hypothetical protein [Nonomuraea dietziae]|uniref:hypothetical protein n=1 Tax=Nonomuraea dietziae TaxID=65515 RepID=UPI0031D8826C
MLGDLAAGGLLDAVRGEVHRRRVVAELRHGPLAEGGLGEGGRGEVGVVGPAHPGGGHDGIGAHQFDGFGECSLPARRQKGEEGVVVHAVRR